ncbi:DegT/DnrJ/EryC1/StrS family aminotransferase [Actinokineospora guangxiensis]|uniref:DegT/DnrJ/EryC1/StrS family aminotransferase n=1 Tax=Actinokineospora guangxiensis TaxID=1490288 RepID=A0ABW0ENU0_9PSEU
MGVPFLDLRAPYAELRAEIDAATARVLASGWYLLGPETEAFEAEFADYCGAEHCVSVASGGDALELVLRAWGIGPGDEVLVPGNTFIATWLAVTAVGARPVPVEPDLITHTVDTARLEAAITPRTRAVIPVHLYGQPADLAAVRAVAERHGLAVLEDAAQAPGATWAGGRIGARGSTVAFSFYPGKNLGSLGDSGAVVTSDPELAAKLRLLRNYGSQVKYHHEVAGKNSRTDELQAAVLRVKLAHLDAWNDRRGAVADYYRSELSGIPGLVLPEQTEGTTHAWHLYVVRHADRDGLRAALERAGVATLVHYPIPPHRCGVYADSHPGPLPLTERLAREVLSLPIGPHLSAAQAARVATAVKHICANLAFPLAS